MRTWLELAACAALYGVLVVIDRAIQRYERRKERGV